jgi:hypothetical protein
MCDVGRGPEEKSVGIHPTELYNGGETVSHHRPSVPEPHIAICNGPPAGPAGGTALHSSRESIRPTILDAGLPPGSSVPACGTTDAIPDAPSGENNAAFTQLLHLLAWALFLRVSLAALLAPLGTPEVPELDLPGLLGLSGLVFLIDCVRYTMWACAPPEAQQYSRCRGYPLLMHSA